MLAAGYYSTKVPSNTVSYVLKSVLHPPDMVPFRFTLFKELEATLETLFKYPGLPTETLFRRLPPTWLTIFLFT